MTHMRAMEAPGSGQSLRLVEREVPRPGDHEALIEVEACGVCHGDAIPVQGRFPGLSHPRIPGHEVVGRIVDAGDAVHGWRVGERVGVGWSGGACMVCEPCADGDYAACADPRVTGLSIDGGYAEYMTARGSALVRLPDGVAATSAAPLLCAGATTFSALKNCRARAGDVVAVHGIGGLGHLAVQYANRLGFTTVALSRGRDKEALARELGAHVYVDTEAGDAAEALADVGGASAILCTAPDAAAITGLVDGLAPGGELVVVAGLSEPLVIHAGKLFRGGRSVKGWHGQRPAEAIEFSLRFGVTPMIETFPLDRAGEAFERMLSAEVRFRAVITMDGGERA